MAIARPNQLGSDRYHVQVLDRALTIDALSETTVSSVWPTGGRGYSNGKQTLQRLGDSLGIEFGPPNPIDVERDEAFQGSLI